MYDLLIKDGTVVDGSGGAGYRADVAVQDGKIAAIGRLNGKARQTIDAEGHVVSPGFVDGHTHMDAQVFWDPLRVRARVTTALPVWLWVTVASPWHPASKKMRT